MNEMNQALRRQSPRSRWLLELATPSVALGRGLPRNEFAAQLRAANVNRPGAGIVEALNRAMKRRHTANLLKQLDTRLLDGRDANRHRVGAQQREAQHDRDDDGESQEPG
jgi:hypothetical protein